MTDYVVVDASIALKLVLREPLSKAASEQAEVWARAGIWPVAPALMLAEATNVIRRRVAAAILTPEVARAGLMQLLNLGIEIRESPEIHLMALDLAAELARPAAYDCHYLALAEILSGEFWTADEKFYNAVRDKKPEVRLLRPQHTPGQPFE